MAGRVVWHAGRVSEDPEVVELSFPDLDELDEWLATPESTQAHGLRLYHAGSMLPLLQRLASAELPALRRLEFERCGLGTDGLHLLVTSGLLNRLTALVIVDDELEHEAIGELLACDAITRLEHLHLAPSASAIRGIVACSRLGELRSLGLPQWLADDDLAVLLGNSLRPEAAAPWHELARKRVAEQLESSPRCDDWEERTGPLLAALVTSAVVNNRAGQPAPHDPTDMSHVPEDILDLADRLRARWPASDRPALPSWLDDALRGPAPALRLAGTLRSHYLRGARRVAEDLDALTALLAHPDALHLRRVDLSYLSLDEPTLARWLAGPWLAGVFGLSLHGHRFGPAALAALTTNPAAAGLRALHLCNSLPGVGDLQGLLASPWTAQLHALELSCNQLDPGDVQALATAPTLVGLQALDLRGCGLSDLAPFADAHWPALRRLTVTENPLGDLAAEQLARVPLPALTRLDLGYPRDDFRITDAGARALAGADSWARLEDLGLEFHAIADAGALALATATKLPALRQLRIAYGNAVTRDGALALVAAASPGLRLDIGLGSNPAVRDTPEVRASPLAMPYEPGTRDPADPPP